MIKVVRGHRVGTKFHYALIGPPVGGLSRQPLLDACRALQRMGVDPCSQIALFRAGRPDWDLRTRVGHGAGLTGIIG
jgi:hypothetical protein